MTDKTKKIIKTALHMLITPISVFFLSLIGLVLYFQFEELVHPTYIAMIIIYYGLFYLMISENNK